MYWETMYGRSMPTKSSNYKRIHHWHERISQLLLLESHIPTQHMLQIGERLLDGTYTILNKDTVRAVLRSLNMQVYIEKWLQIIHRITKIQPPCPGIGVINQLDALFLELQRPFNAKKTPERKNFLNYNYVFCRLFQKMDCTQFCMFFPLIKSKAKVRALDAMWEEMVRCIAWPVTPLQHVDPFAVHLTEPAALLHRLAHECVHLTPVEIQLVPTKTGCHKWDRRFAASQRQPPKRRHSTQLGPEFQRLGLVKRRLH